MLRAFYRRKTMAGAIGWQSVTAWFGPIFSPDESRQSCVFSSSHISVATKADKRTKACGTAGRNKMKNEIHSMKLDRRTVIKTAVAAGVAQIASPFVITARAADAIKIGMVDPLTGAYAAVANNEVIGAKFAVEQINAKGGVLGRPLELLVEDSANDVGTGVQKTRKLIERDQVSFIIGDVNSGVAQAMAQVTAEKKVLHVVSGGHTDGITGKDCKWNVFRVCNTTRTEANAST